MLDLFPDQRLLKGAPATLRAELVDADGELDTSIDSGVTVTINRLDGTALATAQAATSTADGVATYTLTAAQTGAGLDLLTAAWTHNSTVRATTYHEIVGRHWFRASDLKTLPGVDAAARTPPGDTTPQALIDARTWAETLFEWATGVAWVPRVALERLDVRGDTAIWLRHWWPTQLRSLTIDDVAEDVTDWALTDYGTLVRVDGATVRTTTPQGLVVIYDHGAAQPPPPLVEAAMVAAADKVKKDRVSTLGQRLTGASFESGTISFASIDREHPTGLPAVDARIAQYRLDRAGA